MLALYRRRLSHWVATFGGGKQARRRSFSLLLETRELPGDEWRMLGERSWRTGVGFRTEAARRARQARTITVVRYFKCPARSRWLWVEVIPYANTGDAQTAVSHFESMLSPNPYSVAKATIEHRVEGVDIPEISEPWLYEQAGSRKKLKASSLLIGGNIEQIAFVVCASGPDRAWAWEDVVPIATAQSLKLKRALPNNV